MVIPFVYTEEEYKKLEEENKNLKDEKQKHFELIDRYRNEAKVLKEDNDKLQTGPFKYSYIKKLQKQNEKLEEENKKLKERIKDLEKEIEELNKMMLFETKI